MVQMTRNILTDILTAYTFWFWALRQATHTIDCHPFKLNGDLTSPNELPYGVNSDYRTLFHTFSTGYFEHTKDSECKRTNTEAKTLTDALLVCAIKVMI